MLQSCDFLVVGFCVLDIDSENIGSRLNQFLLRLVEKGSVMPFNVSLSFDATVVVPAMLSLPKYGSIVGRTTPNHLMPLTAEDFQSMTGDAGPESFSDLAAELKVFLEF
jgi:hypothetical protein